MATTDMIPITVMGVLIFLDAAGLWYFFKHHNDKYHADIFAGFLSTCLSILFALLWYSGFPSFVDGTYFASISNYYVAGFFALCGTVQAFYLLSFLYIWLFEEYRRNGIN